MMYKFKNPQQRIVFGTLSAAVLIVIYIALQWATHFTTLPFSKAVIVMFVGICTIVYIQEQMARLLKIKK